MGRNRTSSLGIGGGEKQNDHSRRMIGLGSPLCVITICLLGLAVVVMWSASECFSFQQEDDLNSSSQTVSASSSSLLIGGIPIALTCHRRLMTWRPFSTTYSSLAMQVSLKSTNNDLDVDVNYSSGKQSSKRAKDVFDLAMTNAGVLRNAPNDVSEEATIHISHIFSPYTNNDEFAIVSNSWRLGAERAKRDHGINVEFIAAVLPEDQDAPPPFARLILLSQRIPNYRRGAHDVPTYGDIFKTLRDQARGAIVIYSNADIAVVPDFYSKVRGLMEERRLFSRSTQLNLLRQVRETFFLTCTNVTQTTFQQRGLSKDIVELDRAVTLCARDAAVYFENLGGRPPHYASALWRFFKSPSMSAESAFEAAYSTPDLRTEGNVMTITRRQLTKLKPSEVLPRLFPKSDPFKGMNETYLKEIYDRDGDDHPGNDLFVLPRREIPSLLTQTPFIHLRPSGFLIGQLLKYNPTTVFRRIMSTRENPLTFHVGLGTDEYPLRASLQQRQVLFEAAHYFTRLNITSQSFWPPPWCEDGKNYRIGGTAWFCATTRGDYCRGWVRLACTTYWHRSSRDSKFLQYLCERVSTRRIVKDELSSTGSVRQRALDEPFCSFCNVSVSQG